MEPVIGKKIRRFYLSLKKMGDLVFQEGPVISHHVDENGKDYLYYWVDADDQFNRWMVFYTSPELLSSFFEKQITWRALIKNAPEKKVLFVDVDDDLTGRYITLSKIEDVPAAYLPMDTSYFDEELYEPYALELKKHILQKTKKRGKAYRPPEKSPSILADPKPPEYKKPK